MVEKRVGPLGEINPLLHHAALPLLNLSMVLGIASSLYSSLVIPTVFLCLLLANSFSLSYFLLCPSVCRLYIPLFVFLTSALVGVLREA